MLLFVVAVMVLVAVGVLLWKAVSAQALTTGSSTSEDEAPTGPTRTPGAGRPRRTRPIAPDDDPEFLRSLDEQVKRGRIDGQDPSSGT
ncbi:hypothetical protein LQ327_04530 [Actinomycetospora endophytica]|uniref:DivIVA domain-containing protein n=1 Tax=Actinomycetospora endophytica TaxID=2291215 RepID=A0ABS8P335_9PSEU|nr:hypothetical protein [Actinomycetospora endophytica]MCD2192655.1 hypothetical protein [Actinomycetospora endophytica]